MGLRPCRGAFGERRPTIFLLLTLPLQISSRLYFQLAFSINKRKNSPTVTLHPHINLIIVSLPIFIQESSCS